MSYLPGSKICLGTEEDQLLFSRVICVLSNLKLEVIYYLLSDDSGWKYVLEYYYCLRKQQFTL